LLVDNSYKVFVFNLLYTVQTYQEVPQAISVRNPGLCFQIPRYVGPLVKAQMGYSTGKGSRCSFRLEAAISRLPALASETQAA